MTKGKCSGSGTEKAIYFDARSGIEKVSMMVVGQGKQLEFELDITGIWEREGEKWHRESKKKKKKKIIGYGIGYGRMGIADERLAEVEKSKKNMVGYYLVLECGESEWL